MYEDTYPKRFRVECAERLLEVGDTDDRSPDLSDKPVGPTRKCYRRIIVGELVGGDGVERIGTVPQLDHTVPVVFLKWPDSTDFTHGPSLADRQRQCQNYPVRRRKSACTMFSIGDGSAVVQS